MNGLFEKLEILGKGTESIVYKCKTNLGNYIAAKEYRPWYSDMCDKEWYIVRTFDQSSPLLKYYGVTCVDGTNYLLMEYINSITLDEYTSKLLISNPRDISSEIFNIIKLLACQFKYLNSIKLYHADLRFNNILVGENRVIIIDFASAMYSEYKSNDINYFKVIISVVLVNLVYKGFIIKNNDNNVVTIETLDNYLTDIWINA